MLPIIKTLIFLLIVPGTVAVLVPRWILSSAWNRAFDLDAFRFLGLLPLALGAAALLWCMWDFATFGKGTPAPIDAPKFLVRRGLYRFVRNPMYVAIALILGGEAALFQSWSLFLYAFSVWFIQNLFVLLYEEPALKKKFGAEYEEYLNTVPRWIPQKTKRF